MDYAKRVGPIKVSLAIQKLAILTKPAAIDDVLTWYRAAKASRVFPPPSLQLVLVAHPEEIEVQVKEIKVRTYRRHHPK